MRKRDTVHRDQLTLDLFPHERLYPVQVTKELGSAVEFNGWLARAMAQAVKEATLNGVGRDEITRRMSASLGIPVSKGLLDKYTSQASATHTIVDPCSGHSANTRARRSCNGGHRTTDSTVCVAGAR